MVLDARWGRTISIWQIETTHTSTPILVLPDQTKHFWLETDASAYVIGAVLSQLCDDGKWRPVGFVSKSLSETEHNYVIHDKELLSVICGLEEWRHILEVLWCNTKSTLVPPVTLVISLDLIHCSRLSSRLRSSQDFLLIMFSFHPDPPH